MRIPAALLLGVVAVGASAGMPVRAKLVGPPRTVAEGVPWTATISLRRGRSPVAERPVALVARSGGLVERFRARRAGRGLYRARVLLPIAGRWLLFAELRGTRYRAGSVRVVRAAEQLRLQSAYAVVVADGSLLIADAVGHRVIRADRVTGRLFPFAGNGRIGSGGDARPAARATLVRPTGLAIDAQGSVYIADREAHVIRRVDASGRITTFAGNGQQGPRVDGVPAAESSVPGPIDVAADPAGDVYVTDEARVRRIDSETGIITSAVGTGEAGWSGDGGPAREARIAAPHGLEFDAAGNLFIAAASHPAAGAVVRRVHAATGTITTVAGNGWSGFSGDGGPATEASILSVRATPAADGSLYLADNGNRRVRRVDPRGIISTVAGNGSADWSGDGGPATQAGMVPYDVAVADGVLYVADSENRRIRRVDLATGVVTTLVGP